LGTEYFLGDALGSVRQMTDETGEVTFAQAYDPYGVVTQTGGDSQTSYGFTNEYTSQGLVYLRSRMYSPYLSRFIQPDTIVPNPRVPPDWNRYSYVRNNPIVFTDPSGYITENESRDAWDILNGLKAYQVDILVDWGYTDNGILRSLLSVSPDLIKLYGWGCLKWEEGSWSLNELYIVKGAVQNLDKAMNNKMSSFIGPVLISKVPDACGRGCTSLGHIELLDRNQLPKESPGDDITEYYVVDPDINFDQWTIVHELAHAWDARSWAQSRVSLWVRLLNGTGGGFGPSFGCDADHRLPGCNHVLYRYEGKPPKGSDYNFDPKEDFAESVAAYVFPLKAQKQVDKYSDPSSIYYEFLYYSDYTKTERWRFINSLINGTTP